MEKLKLKFQTLSDAIITFESAINQLNKIENATNQDCGIFDCENLLESLRDSLIQRFEYSVDLLWKYLKEYLKIVHGSTPEIPSPKSVIRTCALVKILSEKETNEVLLMIEHRNQTSHIYRVELADLVAKVAPEYLKLMQQIIERTQP